MAVCNPALSKVVPREVAAAVARKQQIETRDKNPSLLKQMGFAQRLLSGFTQMDNLATVYPQLQGWVDMTKLGETIRSRLAHSYNPVVRKVGSLKTTDSKAIMKVVEARNLGMKATENADGTISLKATKDTVGMKAGDTINLNKTQSQTLKDTDRVLGEIYDNVVAAVKASLGFDPATPIDKMPKDDAKVIKLLEDSRRDNYFPQVRSGRYAVQYVDKDGQVHLEGFDTSLKGIKITSSQTRARQRASEMEAAGMTDVKVRDLQAEAELYDIYQPDRSSLANIDALFQAIMVPNKEEAYKVTKRVIDRLKAEAEYGRQGRLRRRKDIPGWLREDNYDTYFRSTFPSYVFTMSDWIANKATEGGRREAINSIKDNNLRKVAEDAETYLHTDDALTAKLKNFTFLYTIGGNLSSAIVQTSQLLHTTWPLLSGVGGTGRAAIETSRATLNILSNLKLSPSLSAEDIFNVDKMNLPDDEKNLIKEMFSAGIAEALLTRDQAPAWLSRTQDPNVYALGQATGKVMDAMSLAFAAMETVNRLATGLATYRMAKDAKTFKRLQEFARNTGTTVETPIDAVRWVVEETQFLMGKPFRAAAMRGMAGGLAFQFMPFAFKMLGFQRRAMEYYGGKGILSLDAGKKVMALHLLGIFATAGLWGLPFAAPLGDLLDKLLKEAGPAMGITPVALKAELREALQGLLKEVPELGVIGTPAELADYFFNGPFRATGVDISKRTALDIIPENLLTFDLLNIGPFMSAVVGGVEDAVNYHKKGMDMMAIASLMPVALRNLARSQAMQEVGYITPGKLEPTLPAREMQDPIDIMKVAAGFTPTKVAEAREALRETKEIGTKMDSIRRSYSDRIALAQAKFIETKDPSYRQEALRLRQEAVDFDKDKPLRDRIIQDAASFNSGVSDKIKNILYPQRPESVPKAVRSEYAQRLQQLKD